ncbi:MAG TPA: MMPL family transporter [Nocardioidaceae bacterium]|nr:MMPL family transporter [Nocardioidaceae bacterium]
MRGFLERLGRACARWHWIVIAAWILIVAGLLVGRTVADGTYTNDYTVPGSQSKAGLEKLSAAFPKAGGFSGQIVFATDSNKKVSASKDAVNTSVANAAKLDHVLAVVSPFATANSPQVSKDGSIAYATINFDVNTTALGDDYLDQFEAAFEPARKANLQVEYGGYAGQIASQGDDKTSEALGLACALVLLLFMFGSLVAAAIPLLSAVFSVLAGLSALSILASAATFPTTAPTVATLLGLGVAVDYGLFLVSRHRDQVDAGMPVYDSIARSNATSGSAIVVAGSTVIIAILGLYISAVPFVGALGLSAAIVVAVTMLAALTLVPAFLGVVKGNVRALSERLHERRERRERAAAEAAAPETDTATAAAGNPGSNPGESGPPAGMDAVSLTQGAHEHSAFARWGKMVAGRPWPWAGVSSLLLIVLAIPLFSIQFGQLDAGTDPKSDTDRRAYDLIAEGFGAGANGPITIVAVPDSKKNAQSVLSKLQKTVANTSGVASVSPPQLNKAGTTATLTAIPTTSPQDQETTDLVDNLRDTVLPGVDGVETFVAGTTAGYVDFTDKIISRLPLLILAVVFMSMILLTTAFRSLAIGLKAAAMNLLSVGASYGVVVAIFQWGWGNSLIGVDQTVPIPAYVPMLMFAIIFGLSMDYEVFLISRVHEAYVATGDSHRSVALGIGGTARVITTAAGIMLVVFTSFVFDSDPTVKMLAIGMAVAVLIDATVVRMCLVPALMSILGDRAWWIPHWLDRILPTLDIEGTATEKR